MIINSGPKYRLLFTGGHNGKVGLYCGKLKLIRLVYLSIQINSQKVIDDKLTTDINARGATYIIANKLT